MPGATLPNDEQERLASLGRYMVLDTASEPRFDALTTLASQSFDVPIALVSLVDRDRQWFKSAVGLAQGAETPRDQSFCAHAILRPDEIMVVEDATHDARFVDNPLVLGAPHIRFYAGVPLRDEHGRGLGALCLIDTKPRTLSATDADKLRKMAVGVTSALDLQRSLSAMREVEAFAGQIVKVSPDCVKLLDLDGRIVFINEAGRRAMEIDDDTVVEGTYWESFWPPAQRPTLRANLDAAQAGRTVRFTEFCPSARLTPKWWEIAISPIPGSDGLPVRLLSLCRDVTAARREREALDKAAAELEAVLESTTDSVIVLDNDWVITYCNRHAAALLGAERNLTGVSLWDVFPGDGNRDFSRHCRTALESGRPTEFEDYVSSLGLWFEVHAFPTPGGLSLFFRDVTERHRTRDRLVDLAHRDTLTGLANRFTFQQAMAERLSQDQPFALLLVDLDHFKEVNDSFGHAVGDQLLKEVAKRLQCCAPSAGTAARLGGDEFAVLLTGEAPKLDTLAPEALAPEARSVAQAINASLAAPFVIEGASLWCGASVGIALTTASGGDADTLMKEADMALYAAKADGRSTWRFFDASMAASVTDRQALKSCLRTALLQGEMAVHYQQVIDLKSGRVAGFEALLRWTCPGRGVVSPAEFIPLAEETGLILSLGRFALREACRRAASWPDPVWVAVNLSPVQFRDPSLVASVVAALTESGLPARRLELEITEMALLRDDEVTLAVLQALRGLGVRIALDDFGTGYASLSYLRSFSFNKIKIDRAFIKDLPGGIESVAIVRAVTSMGRSLGLNITAEGVETEQQLQTVQLHGCSEAQGFYFGAAVAGEDTAGLLSGAATSRGPDFNATVSRGQVVSLYDVAN